MLTQTEIIFRKYLTKRITLLQYVVILLTHNPDNDCGSPSRYEAVTLTADQKLRCNFSQQTIEDGRKDRAMQHFRVAWEGTKLQVRVCGGPANAEASCSFVPSLGMEYRTYDTVVRQCRCRCRCRVVSLS